MTGGMGGGGNGGGAPGARGGLGGALGGLGGRGGAFGGLGGAVGGFGAHGALGGGLGGAGGGGMGGGMYATQGPSTRSDCVVPVPFKTPVQLTNVFAMPLFTQQYTAGLDPASCITPDKAGKTVFPGATGDTCSLVAPLTARGTKSSARGCGDNTSAHATLESGAARPGRALQRCARPKGGGVRGASAGAAARRRRCVTRARCCVLTRGRAGARPGRVRAVRHGAQRGARFDAASRGERADSSNDAQPSMQAPTMKLFTTPRTDCAIERRAARWPAPQGL
jgi:hypothetical protein